MIIAPLKMARFILWIGVSFFLQGCWENAANDDREANQIRTAILSWNKLILELERHTPGYRPPVSARMFAYVQMAAYEAALPGLKDQQPVQDWIPTAPILKTDVTDFRIQLSVNAAYHHLLPLFFPTAPEHILQKVESLYQSQLTEYNKTTDTSGFALSLAYGQQVARAFWEFSMQDTLGHDAFLYNYDKNYQSVQCLGCWKEKEPRKMPALLPYWGRVKTLVYPVENSRLDPPPVYDEAPASKIYTEAFEIFSDLSRVKKSEQWVAELWSDDVPGLTCTTVGRWFSIATQYMEENTIAYPKILETYLLMGIGLSDAAVITWYYKFKYLRERPEDYIRRVIHPEWSPLHEAPAFPAYPSGHAVFSAVAATILTQQFGDNIQFTDNTHKGRKEFNGTPKKYNSFSAMAIECAFSRITLGAHYRSDCESGIQLGHQIGEQITQHPLQKKVSDASSMNPSD